jgi:hypothetical protein
MTYYRARRILMEMLTATEDPMETGRAEELLDAMPVSEAILAVRDMDRCIAVARALKALG